MPAPDFIEEAQTFDSCIEDWCHNDIEISTKVPLKVMNEYGVKQYNAATIEETISRMIEVTNSEDAFCNSVASNY
jgi:hypothetical protein